MFTVIHGDQVPESPDGLPASQGIHAGNFVFLSAQCSADEQGQIINGTMETEMRRTFANVRRVLGGAGLDLKDVVQVRCYLADRNDIPELYPLIL